MRLIEFRNSPELVRQAINLFQQPIMQHILEVVASEHVHKLHRLCRNETEAHIELGKIYGYDECMETLKLCAVPFQVDAQRPLEATFEPPGKDEQFNEMLV